jgi:hypothetical protein
MITNLRAEYWTGAKEKQYGRLQFEEDFEIDDEQDPI